jgi:hypothetical protein
MTLSEAEFATISVDDLADRCWIELSGYKSSRPLHVSELAARVTSATNTDRGVQMKIHEAMNVLAWKGVACAVPHDIQVGYYLSGLGRSLGPPASLATLGAERFLAGIADANLWDVVVQFFYSQAVVAFDRSVHVAAQFLLGAACERALLVFGESARPKMGAALEKRYTNETWISKKTEVLKDLVAGLIKVHTSETWLQDLAGKLDCLAGIYRMGRNEVGHPQMQPDIDVRAQAAYIAAFPSLMNSLRRAAALP